MAAPYTITARNGRAFRRINSDGDTISQVETARLAERFASDLRSRVSVWNHLGQWICDVEPGGACPVLAVAELRAYSRDVSKCPV